jgi:alpha-1,2-mannosyltransferase
MALLTHARRLGRPLTLGSLIFLYIAVAVFSSRGGFSYDFHVFWESARAMGHGQSPYDPVGLAHMSKIAQRDLSIPPSNEGWAVYPPVLYVVMLPLGYLPFPLAAVIGLSLLGAAPALALRVMGVRDWRCYAAAYASVPVVTSTLLGSISSLLMVGCALVWRGRGGTLAQAGTIVAKLFLWPLVPLIAVLEGIRRATVVVSLALALALASWAVIGFADMSRYPSMLSQLSAAEAHDSFSLAGMAYAFGAPPALGIYLGGALGIAVAGLAVLEARRGRRDAAFTLAIVAALLASPIIWMHYFTLVLLPIAARYPRFNAVWMVPLVPWIGSYWDANGHWFAFAATWPWFALVVAACLWPASATRTAAWLRAALRLDAGRSAVRGSPAPTRGS